MYQFNQIPSDAQIQKYLRRVVFGKEVYCPVCKTRKVYKTQGRYRCRKCRIRFSLLSRTWLSNMTLPYQQFWMILWCWTIQIPVRQRVQFTKLSEVTVRHWYEELRTHLPQNQEVLSHLVQLDEAYFGGRSGRALFMGKQIGSRKLAWTLLSDTYPNREHAWKFLHEFVAPDTVLNTDGAAIYKEINQWWPVYHNRDIHKKFEFEHTSEIEGMFGVLRTFIRRMYHHTTYAKFPSLMCEFYFRFSRPEMFESPYEYLLNTLHLVPTG